MFLRKKLLFRLKGTDPLVGLISPHCLTLEDAVQCSTTDVARRTVTVRYSYCILLKGGGKWCSRQKERRQKNGHPLLLFPPPTHHPTTLETCSASSAL
ncbi:hypothetical protein AGOR_G00166350 [Albula goreensis]|uniref:Uncharacterized protein n=1 Tax=Albula goreensis TaxID=1534307 RepID=A0A8T3D1C4_9TELE|nr:hypothetical protein AGOR_G00166350 [Albula goreensis]